MTVKEILEMGIEISSENFIYDSINNQYLLNKEIQPEAKVDLTYYWYDHLSRIKYPNQIKEIDKSIKEHNWDTFSKYYFEENKIPITLPSFVDVSIDNTNIFLGHAFLNEKIFKEITYSEYECG